jgi:hypothetical protein
MYYVLKAVGNESQLQLDSKVQEHSHVTEPECEESGVRDDTLGPVNNSDSANLSRFMRSESNVRQYSYAVAT